MTLVNKLLIVLSSGYTFFISLIGGMIMVIFDALLYPKIFFTILAFVGYPMLIVAGLSYYLWLRSGFIMPTKSQSGNQEKKE